MNRAERRKCDKKLKKNFKKEYLEKRDEFDKAKELTYWITSLSQEQRNALDEMYNQNALERLERLKLLTDRSISSALVEELDYDKEQATKFLEKMDYYRVDEENKIEELKKITGGDLIMTKKKINEMENLIKERCELLIKDKNNKKETIEILQIEFPKASKNMLVNIYAIAKKELNEQTIVDKEVAPVEEISVDSVKVDIEEDAVKEETKGLVIKSKKIVAEIEVEGKFGLYKAKTAEGITIEKLQIKSIEEIDKLKEEMSEILKMI